MSDTRARLVRFFEHHNPEKLSTVDAILTKYAGREAELFQALVSKYGPEPADASGGNSNGTRDRLIRFFEHHNPSKVAEVDTILTKYAGREAELFQALVKKYGPEPEGGAPSPIGSPAASPAASPGRGDGDHRARLVRFFEHHNPEKVSDVDTILEKYRGREVALFQALVSKYGPEPEPTTPDVSSQHQDDRDGRSTVTNEESVAGDSVPNAAGQSAISEALAAVLAKSGPDLHAEIASLAASGVLDLEQLMNVMAPKHALLSMFQKHFGDYENRLRRIFVAYDPNQLNTVPALLKRGEGQEEKLIVQLLNKYGADREPRYDAPTTLVRLTSRVKKDNIEEESLFTDEEEEVEEKVPESMFTAVAEARNLHADAERLGAGECSGDDEHTYPKDEEAWVRLRFELTECDANQLDELRNSTNTENGLSEAPSSPSPLNTSTRSSHLGGHVTVCIGHVLDCYGAERGNMCLQCSERVSRAFDCLWTPVGPQHRQAVLSSFVKEGYLDKLDRGGKWARRYFKAQDNGLHYFDSDKETDKPKPKGFKFFTTKSQVIENVSAEQYKIKTLDPKYHHFGVTVGHGNEPYFLRTTSEAEKQSWITFVKEALHRLANSGGCKDPNPGRWRGRFEGFKKASEEMANETSSSANDLHTLRKRVEAERAALTKGEEEISLARTQANEMSEQELALQRLVETAYARLEEHRARAEVRKEVAKAKCDALAKQRLKLQEDLRNTQSEVENLKESIAILHRKIIELEAEEQAEEAKCRKVAALYRRCEERARGAKLPSKVFTPSR